MIPPGHLVSYGELAKAANIKHGLGLRALSVAWLRKKLYLSVELGYDTAIPLHRIASQGDVNSLNDAFETKVHNDQLCKAEGSLATPIWVKGEELVMER